MTQRQLLARMPRVGGTPVPLACGAPAPSSCASGEKTESASICHRPHGCGGPTLRGAGGDWTQKRFGMERRRSGYETAALTRGLFPDTQGLSREVGVL